MKHWLIGGFVSLLLGILFIGALGIVVMFLWNWLIPSIFHAETIDLWQALGLLALSRILFANFGGSWWSSHHHRCEQCNGSGWHHKKQNLKQQLKAKFNTLSAEEKEQWKSQMQKVCQPTEDFQEEK
jgi:hypothetical protein